MVEIVAIVISWMIAGTAFVCGPIICGLVSYGLFKGLSQLMQEAAGWIA